MQFQVYHVKISQVNGKAQRLMRVANSYECTEPIQSTGNVHDMIERFSGLIHVT